MSAPSFTEPRMNFPECAVGAQFGEQDAGGLVRISEPKQGISRLSKPLPVKGVVTDIAEKGRRPKCAQSLPHQK